MSYKTIKFELKNKIANITFNQPKTYNSMTIKFWQELIDVFNEINEAFKKVPNPISSTIHYIMTIILIAIGFIILVFSETTLRYSTSSSFSLIIYLIAPLIFFVVAYSIFKIKSKNV